MNTNRLENVADRQRVNHVRDLCFVVMVAMILVFQVLSLSQARATSHNFWMEQDTAQTVEIVQQGECIEAPQSQIAALSDGTPHC